VDGQVWRPSALEALLAGGDRRGDVGGGARDPGGSPGAREDALEASGEAEREPSPGGFEDARLVRAARKGDQAAFETLVRRHLAVAHRVAFRVVGDTHDAEDVCQDALIQALRHLESCRRPEAFRAWLLTIVKNRALNLVKSRRVRSTDPLSEADALVDPYADASRAVQSSETRERVTGALATLTELQRSVVLLFDGEGWTHREIGGKLGISEGSSRVHLHTARSRLRDLLKDLDPFGGRDE